MLTRIVTRALLLGMLLVGPPCRPPSRFVPRDGATLYRPSCQACHMAAGQGAAGAGIYPALAK